MILTSPNGCRYADGWTDQTQTNALAVIEHALQQIREQGAKR